jgi:hypothetical protein
MEDRQMVRRVALVGCFTAFVTGLVTAQGAVPPELAAMADTEREFAKTATIKGWRDAFLDFAYVRLWNRDASGRWWLMVDVAQPFRP